MAQILKTKSIYYNDVNLVAQPCKVKSRKDIPVELNRIIISPMEAIVGKTFALKANELGLTVCLHRFCSIDEQDQQGCCLDHRSAPRNTWHEHRHRFFRSPLFRWVCCRSGSTLDRCELEQWVRWVGFAIRRNGCHHRPIPFDIASYKFS